MHRKFSWNCRIMYLPPLPKALSLSLSSRKILASFLIDAIQTWQAHLCVALQKALHSSFSWHNLNSEIVLCSVSHELCSDNFPSFCFLINYCHTWELSREDEELLSVLLCTQFRKGVSNCEWGNETTCTFIIPVVLIQRVVLTVKQLFWNLLAPQFVLLFAF